MIAVAVAIALLTQQPAELARDKRTIEGWTVNIRRELLQKDKDLTEAALTMLTAQLKEIKRVVPKAAVIELQKVPLWFSPEYPGLIPRAEYHPGAQWLREHGRDPVMAHGVEFTNVRIFAAEVKRMPIFVLHELAHAYHDRVLGFENKTVIKAYELAKASGKYDNVERNNGKRERAYAMTDPREYFAEGTEAYFGENDFYPFNRNDLKTIDPILARILESAWSDPKAVLE